MNRTLHLIRGLPGSGKSTQAIRIVGVTTGTVCHFEADQYFENDGKYVYVPSHTGNAHALCQEQTASAMRACVKLIVVSNTFSQQWEMKVYKLLAEAYGYRVEIVDLFDAGLTDEELANRNRHSVPLHVIAAMRARWEK